MKTYINLKLASAIELGARALTVIALLSPFTATIGSEQQNYVKEYEHIKSFRTVNLRANVEIQTLAEKTEKAFLTVSMDKGLKEYLKTLKISLDGGCLSLSDESGNQGSPTITGENMGSGAGGISIRGKVSNSQIVSSGTNIGSGAVGISIGGDVSNSQIISNGANTEYRAGRIRIGGKVSNSQIILGSTQSEVQAPSLPTIKLVLSQNIPTDLSARAGKWEIGDTCGTFRALLKEGCKMDVSSISEDAEVNISGAGNFEVKSVQGNDFKSTINGSGVLKIGKASVKNSMFRVNGSGNVNIDEGKITEKLNASIVGQGSMRLNCSTKDAELESNGSADIWVREVTGALNNAVSGTGKITVSNRR